MQALALALGFLFVSLYNGVLGDLENLLFGTFLGISDGQVLTLAAIAAGSLLALLALGRRLLLASVDPDLASARGVPARGLSVAFLVLLGLAVAATSQITGVLLVFALLVAPPATAQALAVRPGLSLALTVAIGLVTVWVGLGISYFSVYPAGFFITMISFALYVLARRGRAGREMPPRRRAAFALGGSELDQQRGGGRDRLMFGQEFMRNAFLAGTFIALACGVSGWFVVLRGQVFAGDALSHVAFPGALAAAAAGVDERIGLFAATVLVGAGIGAARACARAPAGERRGREAPRRRTPRSARCSRSCSDWGCSS